MPERPVPQSDVPGEKTSKTQPFPTKPAPYARQFVTSYDDLIDFTPELHAEALDMIKKYYKLGPMFTPGGGQQSSAVPACPVCSGLAAPAAPTGRAAASIPETQTVFVPAQ